MATLVNGKDDVPKMDEHEHEDSHAHKPSTPPRRFYLISNPRTASNLLRRMLALDDQPSLYSPKHDGGYYFLPPVVLSNTLQIRAKNIDVWTADEKAQMKACFQSCVDELAEHAQAAARQGKHLFVKEHSCLMVEPAAQSRFLFGEHSVTEPAWTAHVAEAAVHGGAAQSRTPLNATIMPDALLKTFSATFLIRHPALAFPSYYRMIADVPELFAAENKDMELQLYNTYRWSRTLYEWYARNGSEDRDGDGTDGDGEWPLVLDADDVMMEPDVVVRFAELVGLDTSMLQFEWAPATQEERAAVPYEALLRMRTTLFASAGIEKGKAAGAIDVDVEAGKWREEFGERDGARMEKMVRDAMPDYEFMRARRLRPRAEK